MSFLKLNGKRIVVFGLANKKSVASAIGHCLREEGAEVIHVVRNEARRAAALKLFPESPIYCCDVADEANIIRVRDEIAKDNDGPIHGLVHSIAFANYSAGLQPFHRTVKADFLQAVDISCFSLIAIANHFSPLLASDASVVTISISTTRMAAENYGYMAPIKAALESYLCFLAQSFAQFSTIRFNAVCPGLLKTSASAGIPGYVDSYLFAEQVIPRKRGVETQEAAHCAAFLLSERSSGINAQSIVVDAGMAINYFDHNIVRQVNAQA